MKKELKKLAGEYRKTMDKDVLHSWAKDVIMLIDPSLAETEANLTDLVGKGVLDAVDFSTESHERWEGADVYEDASACRFRLNGKVYLALEDPSDGYRSSLGKFVIQPDAKLVNVFPSIEVFGLHKQKNGYHDSDTLQLFDMTTGKLVLEVGTDNSDDYYPSFVASFSPENMASNIGVAS